LCGKFHKARKKFQWILKDFYGRDAKKIARNSALTTGICMFGRNIFLDNKWSELFI